MFVCLFLLNKNLDYLQAQFLILAYHVLYSPHRLLHGLGFLVSLNLVLLNIAKIFIPPLPFTVSLHVTLLSTLTTFNLPLFKFLTCSTALMILDLQYLAKCPVLLQRKHFFSGLIWSTSTGEVLN